MNNKFQKFIPVDVSVLFFTVSTSKSTTDHIFISKKKEYFRDSNIKSKYIVCMKYLSVSLSHAKGLTTENLFHIEKIRDKEGKKKLYIDIKSDRNCFKFKECVDI